LDGSLTMRTSFILDNGGTYAGLGGFGGGLNSNSAELVLDDVTIDGNYALYGGGLYATAGSITITDSRINDNRALYGGGMFIGASGNIRVRGTEISSNLAQRLIDRTGAWSGGEGGGVALTTDHYDFYQSPVVYNRAEGSGAGIYIDSPGVTQGYFTHAPVAYNFNEYGPAGIAIVRGQLGLANSTLSNNQGLGNGLAFHNGSQAVTGFVHVTVADNSAVDGADYTRPVFNEDGGQLTLANSLLVGIGTDAACWGDFSGIVSRGGNVIASLSLCRSNSRTDDADIPTPYQVGGHTYLPLTEIDGTLVHPLPLDSQAVEFIDPPACNRDDQRLAARPQGTHCEAGAYEMDAETLGFAQEPLVLATVTPPELTIPVFIFTQNALCRSGPSTSYPAINSYNDKDEIVIAGRNSDNSWFRLAMQPAGHCWVSIVTGTPIGPWQALQVFGAPPTATTEPVDDPDPATDTPQPQPTVTATCYYDNNQNYICP
jgi:predicted outer membrane repeat protein